MKVFYVLSRDMYYPVDGELEVLYVTESEAMAKAVCEVFKKYEYDYNPTVTVEEVDIPDEILSGGECPGYVRCDYKFEDGEETFSVSDYISQEQYQQMLAQDPEDEDGDDEEDDDWDDWDEEEGDSATEYLPVSDMLAMLRALTAEGKEYTAEESAVLKRISKVNWEKVGGLQKMLCHFNKCDHPAILESYLRSIIHCDDIHLTSSELEAKAYERISAAFDNGKGRLLTDNAAVLKKLYAAGLSESAVQHKGYKGMDDILLEGETLKLRDGKLGLGPIFFYQFRQGFDAAKVMEAISNIGGLVGQAKTHIATEAEDTNRLNTVTEYDPLYIELFEVASSGGDTQSIEAVILEKQLEKAAALEFSVLNPQTEITNRLRGVLEKF